MSISAPGSLQTSPSSTVPATIPALTSADVVQGRILYLPPKAEAAAQLYSLGLPSQQPARDVLPNSEPLEDGFYDHPILVYSRPAADPNRIHVLLLTSFHGQTLKKRFKARHSQYQWRNYMAIRPAPDHPLLDTDPLYQSLDLTNGSQMHKRGYVKVSAVYTMDWRGAQHYWGGRLPTVTYAKLDDNSFQQLSRGVRRMTHSEPGPQYRGAIPPVAAPHQQILPRSPVSDRPFAWSIVGVDFDRHSSDIRVAAGLARNDLTSSAVQSSAQSVQASKTTGERQPLLPGRGSRSASESHERLEGSGEADNDESFFGWLWRTVKCVLWKVVCR